MMWFLIGAVCGGCGALLEDRFNWPKWSGLFFGTGVAVTLALLFGGN